MINFLNTHSKKILIALSVVVVVVTAAGLGYIYFTEEKESGDVLAKVGDEKITQNDLNQQIYGLSFDEELVLEQKKKDELLQQMIEMEIAVQEAAKLGITVSSIEIDNDIKANLGEQYNSYTQAQKDLTRENTKKKLLLSKVIDREIGWREGKALIYNFHKYYPSGSDGYQVAGQGNEALIDKQRAAATALAESHSKQLNNKEITPDQALQQLLKDPDIGVEAMKPRTPAMLAEFSKDDYNENLSIFGKNASLKEETAKLQKGQASTPIVEQALVGGKNVDVHYLVLYVEEASGGRYKSLEEWYSSKKEEYGVTSKVAQVLNYIVPSAYALGPSGCNSKASDVADIKVITKYYSASNTLQILDLISPDSQPSPKFRIVGGSSCDPAILPNGLDPVNRNISCGGTTLSSCTNCVYDKDFGTTNDGTASLCTTLSSSYYCHTQKIGYIKLPLIDDQYVASGLTTIFSNTTKNAGYWSNPDWTNLYRRSWSNDNNPASFAFCMNTGSCDGPYSNGLITSAKFYWHPQYTRTLTAVKDPASTGSGTVVSPVNFESKQVNLTCTGGTCTGSSSARYYIDADRTVTATPSSGSSVSWVSGCQSTSTGTNGSQICNVTMGGHRTVTFKFVAAAPTALLTANPTSINQGKSSTLTYTTTNATRATIDQSIGAVTPNITGTKSVTPDNTITYTLTAEGAGGTATSQATVTVNKPCTIPTFTASTTSGEAPLGVTFNYSALNATSTYLDFGDNVVNVAPGISGTSSHTYTVARDLPYPATFTCFGPAGNSIKQINIQVNNPPGSTNHAPVVTLLSPADRQYVTNNTQATLRASVYDEDGDMVTARLWYQKDKGEIIYCDAVTKTAKPAFEITCTTSNLIYSEIDGNDQAYHWTGQATDEKGQSALDPPTRQILIKAPPSLSCDVNPATGLSPMVVKVDITGVNITPPYDLDMGEAGKPVIKINEAKTTIYYTYSKEGDYKVQLIGGAITQVCEQHVIVKNPKSSDGGEIAP